MGFPTKNELDRVRKKLQKVEPSFVLPKDANATDRLKYNLCKEMVVYLKAENISQAELARILEIDPARVSEIMKYKIDLYTVDRLLDLLYHVRPNLKVTVA